jgi:hypothetical protein
MPAMMRIERYICLFILDSVCLHSAVSGIGVFFITSLTCVAKLGRDIACRVMQLNLCSL